MNKKLLYIIGIIFILIIIIALIPSNSSKPEVQKDSLLYEHGTLTMPYFNPNSVPQITEEATILVDTTRPEAGYTAFLNGNYVAPVVTPTVEPGDDNQDGDNADNDDNDNNDNKPEDPDADPADSFVPKSPSEVSDTGERANPTEEIVLRSSPYYRQTNIVVYVQVGTALVVTDDYISSKDPTIPFWVEVLYGDKVLYARGDVVTVGY